MPRYGSNPAQGLEPRICANPECGKSFQPYRASTVTCSVKCYKRLPAVRERDNAARRTPEERARRLALRKARPQYEEQQQRYVQTAFLRRYGLSPGEYEAKLAAQGGLCALCGRPPNPDSGQADSRLHQDHDHLTGRNRDLLCGSCNRGVGLLQDDPDLLRAAATYIERHRTTA